jgi:endonuclease/exonuclease/phosphatase (EEP) superfamily protein YafD
MPMMDLTTGGLALARLVDHDVILVKEGLPPGFLKTSNPQSGHFEYIIRLPDAGIEVTRGWCSVDVFSRGENFRFICSHLETEAVPQLQYVQAMELLAGPANTKLPVILVGDFNTDPLGRDGTFTYPLFGQAGFKDSWLQLNPDNPEGGLTWGHDELLADPTNAFETRLDLILYRGGNFVPASASVIDVALDRSSPPLWGSDHASLSVNFSVSVPQSRKAEKAMAE